MNSETLSKYLKPSDRIKLTCVDNLSLDGYIKEITQDSIVVVTERSLLIFSLSEIKKIEKSLTSIQNLPKIYDHDTNEVSTEEHVAPISNEVTLNDTEIVKPEMIELSAELGFDDFELDEIPWKEDGLPEEDLFKGRDELIERLIKHYKSLERKKTYMLYGLTRTGKSSILKYFDKQIFNQQIKIDKTYKFFPFIWDLSKAANQSLAKDMWSYLIGTSTADRIKKYNIDNHVNLPDSDLLHLTEYRAKHLREIIAYLKINGYFPIFLIDEFTYYENLVNSKKVDSSFLQTFRQLAFDNFACFVYAGTYNLKKLLKDPKYGLTGQFVNTIEESVAQIEKEPAMQLITVFDKIKFDDGATENILLLSNNIPYFIQIICKNVAFYCYENKINIVDSDIVEEVIKILVGDVPTPKNTMIRRISSGTFDSNQFNATAINEIALISTIAFLEKDHKMGKGVKFNEVLQFWNEKKIPQATLKANEAMEELKEKGVLTMRQEKEGIPSYKIGVDLFRRWLQNEKPDIELEIGKLQN